MGFSEKFWLKIWVMVFTLLVIFVVSLSVYSAYKMNIKANLINAGHDPIYIERVFDGR